MTLYISDLDGSLLSPDGSLSPDARTILTRLVADGLHFTVATARTPLSTLHLLEGIPLSDPMILLNGALCYDPKTRGFSHPVPISRKAMEHLALAEQQVNLGGLLFSLEEGTFRTSQGPNVCSASPEYARIRAYPGISAIDPQLSRRTAQELLDVPVLYGLYEDDRPERLEQLARCLEGQGLTMDFYRDRYSRQRWCLEFFNAETCKGAAAAHLRREGYDRLVAFGDGWNDLSLFAACDCGCAMENAAPELKEKADIVIGSNAQDGVVRYLQSLTISY